jgi:hypothetical protein
MFCWYNINNQIAAENIKAQFGSYKYNSGIKNVAEATKAG